MPHEDDVVSSDFMLIGEGEEISFSPISFDKLVEGQKYLVHVKGTDKDTYYTGYFRPEVQAFSHCLIDEEMQFVFTGRPYLLPGEAAN